MTLEQLRIFVAAAGTLSMTRAAEQLHLTQPAVSAAVAALEARHAVRLFNRVGRRLELTEAGRMFCGEAEAILERVVEAQRRLSDLNGLLIGEVRLAASQTVATYWLPPRMARFAAAWPGITLPMAVGNTAQTVEAVLAGHTDIGVVEGEVDEPLLAHVRVGGDRLGLFVAPGHELVDRIPRPEDLLEATWVLRERGSGTRDHFALGMAAVGLAVSDLKVRLELPSNGAVLEAVTAGGLIAAISTLAGASRMASGSVCQLPYLLPPRNFLLLTHRARRPGRAAQAFIAAISDQAARSIAEPR
jgi:DNA-binding transcriptional LysR family regulator